MEIQIRDTKFIYKSIIYVGTCWFSFPKSPLIVVMSPFKTFFKHTQRMNVGRIQIQKILIKLTTGTKLF